jgi:hypothetical protein
MASKYLNFRATAGYVTDTAGQTYVITDDTYSPGPTVRGGHTFGWINASQPANSNHRDRDNTNDSRLAGMAFQGNDGNTSTFRLNVSSGQQYAIHIALGDASNPQSNYYALLQDDASTITTINVAGGSSAGQWVDATGVVRTSDADWISNSAAVTHTFSSAIFYITIGTPTSTSSVTPLAHLALVEVVAAGQPTSIRGRGVPGMRFGGTTFGQGF